MWNKNFDEKWQVIVWDRLLYPRSIGIVVYFCDCFSPRRYSSFSRFTRFTRRTFFCVAFHFICISLPSRGFHSILSTAWVQFPVLYMFVYALNVICGIIIVVLEPTSRAAMLTVYCVNGKHAIFFELIFRKIKFACSRAGVLLLLLLLPKRARILPALHWQICGKMLLHGIITTE